MVDLVITDLAVFRIVQAEAPRMTLVELADGVTVDEIKAKTEAQFDIAPGLAG